MLTPLAPRFLLEPPLDCSSILTYPSAGLILHILHFFFFFFALKAHGDPRESAAWLPQPPAQPRAPRGPSPSPRGGGLGEEFSRSSSPREPPCHRRKRLPTPLPPPRALPGFLPAAPPAPATRGDPWQPLKFILVRIPPPQLPDTHGAASAPSSAGAVGGGGESRKREQASERARWKV